MRAHTSGVAFLVRNIVRAAFWLSALATVWSPASAAASPPPPIREADLVAAVSKYFSFSKIAVKTTPKEGGGGLSNLSFRMEGVTYGRLSTDFLTVSIDDPVLDVAALAGKQTLRLLGSSRTKVTALISADKAMAYILRLVSNKYGVRRLTGVLRLTPPFIEFEFRAPTADLPQGKMDSLKKFLTGDTVEGYAAIVATVKRGVLSVDVPKAILNHFLIPASLIAKYKEKFNPFDAIPVVQPFGALMESVSVMPKYLMISN